MIAARLAPRLLDRFDFVVKKVSGSYALLIWRATSKNGGALEGAGSFVTEAGRIASSRFTTS